jgi:chromosomal replication initiator protein
MSELWAKTLADIKDQIGAQNFETWIAPIRFVSRNKNDLVLDVPNKFFRDWLTEHYANKLERILSSAAKHDVKISFQVNERLAKLTTSEKVVRKDDKERDKPQRPSNLVAKYTFENFVIGASNQFAHAACVAVANQPGDNYNPLFIYGGVVLGKNH